MSKQLRPINDLISTFEQQMSTIRREISFYLNQF
jgi:hypothetical protein